MIDTFKSYMAMWHLQPDGAPFQTPMSHFLPVIFQHRPAMLKIACCAEERRAGKLMIAWQGQGAANIFAYDEHALLMERAQGSCSLITMAKQQDDEASKILCQVAKKLHDVKIPNHTVELIPLIQWFDALFTLSPTHDILYKTAKIAQALLQTQQQNVVLHGDIHHGNILDFGERGWLAIDPKGLMGERSYDFANIFCNPNQILATQTGRLAHQATIVAKTANLDRNRLLQWIAAYAGLSAAWHFEDGADPSLALEVAQIALSECQTR